jgi:serine/threonine protein kinase/Tfp pilus assembly protein PilF
MRPALSAEEWRRAEALFQRALALPAAERAAMLDRECAADEPLRRQVAALLVADAEAGDLGFLAAPAAELLGAEGGMARQAVLQAAGGEGGEEEDWTGRRFGPYRVERELGRGGMGTVFVAARTDGQFEQRVALKVIRQSLPGEGLRRRFLRERQILARLEHPNIARLLDGGLSEDGLPYFVMELVAGEPVTDFCARRALGLEERVRLFVDVCTAVQYAHRNLVVHRDLKPSNILVTAAGEVRLLDFGIAKLLGDDDEAGLTHTGMPLTPAYAAPEQLRGEPVTTAADVYALGVVLFELLAGQRPHAPVAGGAGGAAEAAAVLQSQPPRPSAVAQAAGAADPAHDPRAAARRGRRLRGDLDTIVLTALRKEPERRYPSAEALAEDLRRHLAGQPIRARPDTFGYRAGRFLSRHRLAATAAAVALCALLLALGAAVFQAQARTREARKAQEEARRARAVTRFVIGLFEGADPARSRGEAVTARQLLDDGALRLHGELADQPAARAALLDAVAASYAALGLYDRALPLAQESARLRRGGLPASAPELAESLDRLGTIWVQKSDYARAGPLLREALQLRRRALGDKDPAVAASLASLAGLLHKQGEFGPADRLYREALEVTRASLGPDHPETARRLNDLAANLQDRGDYGPAGELFRQALALRQKVLGADHPDVAASLYNLGSDLTYLGRYPEAERDLDQALALRRRIFGASHPDIGFTLLGLADVYDSTGRVDAAEQAVREALAIFRRAFGDQHRQVTECLNFLAALRYSRNDYAGAEALFRQILPRTTREIGAEHPDTLSVKANLAMALRYQGRLDEAERLLRETLAVRRRILGNQHINVAQNLGNLAGVMGAAGHAASAVPLCREAVEIYRRALGEGHEQFALALFGLALAEADAGEQGAADADFRRAVAIVRQLHAHGGSNALRVPSAYGGFLLERGRLAEAEPLLREAVAWAEAAPGGASGWIPGEAQLLLGECLRRRGLQAASERLFRAGRAALRASPGVERELLPQARALLAGP